MYDITDNKPRTKLADYLEQQGLVRLQYSVFSGEVEAHHWNRIWKHITHFFRTKCQPEDKVFSMVVDSDHFRKMDTLGPEPEIAWIMDEIHTFYL